MKGSILCWEYGDFEQALEAYNEAIRLNPQDDSAYSGKADIFIMLNRGEEALTAIEQAILINPNDNSEHTRDMILALIEDKII